MKLLRLRTIAAFNDLARGMGMSNVRLHLPYISLRVLVVGLIQETSL